MNLIYFKTSPWKSKHFDFKLSSRFFLKNKLHPFPFSHRSPVTQKIPYSLLKTIDNFVIDSVMLKTASLPTYLFS